MNRNGRIDTGRIMRLIRFILLSALMLCATTTAAFAAAGSFSTTAAVSSGDVVVWDPTVNFGVKTTSIEGVQAVAGVADESVAAGNTCVVRQDGARVAVNVVGAVARGQWLITSTTPGKARGVDTLQAGVFARALTNSGVPGAGRCYASVNLGFLSSEGGETISHATLSNLNWLSAGHTFDANLNIGAYDFQSTGDFTDGTNAVSSAQAKTAYDHSQVAGGNPHGTGYADISDFQTGVSTNTDVAANTAARNNSTKFQGRDIDEAGIGNGKIWKYDSAAGKWLIGDDAGASTGAPTDAPYITQTHDPSLTAEQALSDLATGILKNMTGTGVLSIAVAGTDYSAPGHTHAEYEIAAENNDAALVSAVSSFNVNGEDLKFTNPGGSQVNLEFGTTYGTLSGGTRTICVNGSTGSDSNVGTAAYPLATVQKAWDVLPAVVQEPIVIDIAAGTYGESVIFAGKQMGSAAASLTVQGALVNSDSGTATGTQTATTLQDTGKSWGANAHQYKLVRITGGTGAGQHAWIASNTVNTLTIAGAWNTTPISADTTYSIDEPGTIVNGGAGNNSVTVDNIQNLTLKFLKGTSCARFMLIDNKTEASIIACTASGANVTAASLTLKGKSYLQTDSEAYFADAPASSGFIIEGMSLAPQVRRFYSRSCGSLGMQVSQESFLYLQRSRTEGNTSYGIRATIGSTLQLVGNYIFNESVGIRAENMSSAWSASAQTYSGCGTNYEPVGEGNNNSYGS